MSSQQRICIFSYISVIFMHNNIMIELQAGLQTIKHLPVIYTYDLNA